MNTTTAATLSKRDRAVLHAVAAGRCQMSGGCGPTLVIDGMCYADQFAGARLIGAGLIAVPRSAAESARLTRTGRAFLAPAWRTPPSTAASAEAISPY
jgi:hypothetical protein